jgi:hypothetical protein
LSSCIFSLINPFLVTFHSQQCFLHSSLKRSGEGFEGCDGDSVGVGAPTGGCQFRSAQEKNSNDVTVILVELPAPPPKNVEQVIYEYVDRKKVLYFLR